MGMMREVLFDLDPRGVGARARARRRRRAPRPGFDVWFSPMPPAREPLQRFSDAESAADALDAVLVGSSRWCPSVGHAGAPATPSGAPRSPSRAPGASPSGAFRRGRQLDAAAGGHFDATLQPSWASARPSAPATSRGSGIATHDGCVSWKIAAAVAGAAIAIGALLLGGAFLIGALELRRRTRRIRTRTTPTAISPARGRSPLATEPAGWAPTRAASSSRGCTTTTGSTWALTRGAGYEGIGVVDGATLGVAWSNMNGYMLYMFKFDGARLQARVFGADGRPIGSEELEGPSGFSGTYTLIHGVGMSGLYAGKVTITPHADCYTLTWTTNRGSWAGIGLKSRDGYVVGAMPNGHQAGVVAYDVVTPRRLSGRWAVMGDARTGTELLLKK